MTDITGSTTTTPRHEFTLEPDTTPYSHILVCSWSLPDNEVRALQQALAASEHFLTCTATEGGIRYRLVFNEHADPTEVINFISETVEEVLGATRQDPGQRMQFRVSYDESSWRIYCLLGWRMPPEQWGAIRKRLFDIQAVATVTREDRNTCIRVTYHMQFDLTSLLRLIEQVINQEAGATKTDGAFPAAFSSDPVNLPEPRPRIVSVPAFRLYRYQQKSGKIYVAYSHEVPPEVLDRFKEAALRSPAVIRVKLPEARPWKIVVTFDTAFDLDQLWAYLADEFGRLTGLTLVETADKFSPIPVGPDLPES